jgi:hypothetical protein
MCGVLMQIQRNKKIMSAGPFKKALMMAADDERKRGIKERKTANIVTAHTDAGQISCMDLNVTEIHHTLWCPSCTCPIVLTQSCHAGIPLWVSCLATMECCEAKDQFCTACLQLRKNHKTNGCVLSARHYPIRNWFDSFIKPILEVWCTWCHSPATQSEHKDSTVWTCQQCANKFCFCCMSRFVDSVNVNCKQLAVISRLCVFAPKEHSQPFLANPVGFNPKLAHYLCHYNVSCPGQFTHFEKLSESEWKHKSGENCDDYILRVRNRMSECRVLGVLSTILKIGNNQEQVSTAWETSTLRDKEFLISFFGAMSID